MYFVISQRKFPADGKKKSVAFLMQRMRGDLSYLSMEHHGVIVYGAPSVSEDSGGNMRFSLLMRS